jgi:hypothetical protein
LVIFQWDGVGFPHGFETGKVNCGSESPQTLKFLKYVPERMFIAAIDFTKYQPSIGVGSGGPIGIEREVVEGANVRNTKERFTRGIGKVVNNHDGVGDGW